MLTRHIALVPEADGVNPSELARVSAALQKQVIRDVTPVWGVAATVDAFPRLEDVPIGYYPIIVSLCDLGPEAGIYLDGNGHPYAQIELWASWSLDASRACIEMLLNPFGNHSVTGPSPRSDQGPVEFVVEACAPCAGPLHAYAVNDVIVSDFCTPAYFGYGGSMQTERYSFTGAAEMPFEVLEGGGHLTWYDPASDSWWRRSHFGDAPIDTRLDQAGRQIAAVRELARGDASEAADRLSLASFEARLGVTRKHAVLASQVRAQRLRALLGQGLDAEVISYGSVPPSRVARGRTSNGKQEVAGLLRGKTSTIPGIQPKRDDRPGKAVIDVEATAPAIEREIEVEAEEMRTEPEAPAEAAASTAAQPVSSKPPPLPVSQAPAAAPQPAAPQPPGLGAPYVSGYPQVPAVVFTTPPAAPVPHSGARDTAFLLGGALAAAAVITLLWSGRTALSNDASRQGVAAPAAQVQASAPATEPSTQAAQPAPTPEPNVAPRPSEPARSTSPSTTGAPAEPASASAARSDQGASSRHKHRHDDAAEPPAPTPAPALSARATEKPASPTLDDLLDTRR